MNTGELLASINLAITQNPQVILCPWGPFGIGPAEQAAIHAALNHHIKFVLPAGNDPQGRQPLLGSSLASQVAIAAAANRSAEPAPFSTAGSAVLWTIGVDVPTKQANGEVKLRSGTSFASAIAAGMIVRVMGERPDLEPAQVIELLRSTAKSRGGTSVALLNLDAALAKLKAGG